MKTKKQLVHRAGMALAAVLFLPLAACGGGSGDSAETGQTGELTTIKLATFPGGIFYTDVVAEKKGFFEDAGLKVEFIRPQSGAESTRLTVAGEIAGLISDGGNNISARASGQDVKIIGSVLNINPWQIYADDNLMKNASGTFEERLKALKGKTVGVTGIGAGSDLTLRAMAASVGLDPKKDLKILGVGLLQAAQGQFKSGQIDAYVGVPPFGAVLENSGLAKTYIDVATEAPASISQVTTGQILTSAAWLKKNEAVADRWISAQEKAIAWVMDPANEKEAAEIFLEANAPDEPLEVGVGFIKAMRETGYKGVLKGLKVPREQFQNHVELLQSNGVIKGGAVRYEDMVTKRAQE